MSRSKQTSQYNEYIEQQYYLRPLFCSRNQEGSDKETVIMNKGSARKTIRVRVSVSIVHAKFLRRCVRHVISQGT
jgi:hypothetical protein